MPDKKDSYQATPPEVTPEVANQQVVQVLLDLLKEARQRSSITPTAELSEEEKRNIESATAIFTLIAGGLNLETPFATTRTENNSGPATGNTPVRILGTNFVAPAEVFFERGAVSKKAVNPTLIDTTRIEALSPPRTGEVTLPVGSVDVVVTTFGGSVRVVNGFTYTN